MSNIAERLLRAGFLKEAQEYCDRAIGMKDCHPNVGLTIASIKKIPDEEEKSEKELLEKVRSKAQFYKLFGQALSLQTPEGIPTLWATPDAPVTLTIANGMLTAQGSYDKPLNALASLMGGGSTERMTVKYHGRLEGRSVWGHVIRHREDHVPSLLGEVDYKTDVLMVLSPDGETLRVMEKIATGNGLSSGLMSFYSIVRQPVFDEELIV